MPIYEYTCQNCHKTFEKLVRTMNGPGKVPCPECGSVKTARALSLFAVGAEGAPKGAPAEPPPMCGRCGGAPGSCQLD